MEYTTIPEPSRERVPAPGDCVAALVVIDCPKESWRLGETAVIHPGHAVDEWLALGRGPEQPSDTHRRLRFVRSRPGGIEAVPELGIEHISRQQALISADCEGLIHVRNLGRCRMLHGGKDVESAVLAPGDVVQFGQQLMLLATTRNGQLSPPDAGYKVGAFGEADAHGMVGESPAIWRLRSEVAFVAARSEHVLVTGASGTGKELVARALHALSDRGARPFVARNAATIPEGILDAELFGNLRNYPNAGMPDRPGLIGQANGTVLFLDELAELPVAMQAHLLRVLDAGEYQRLGEAVPRCSDFRLIAATNRPLESIKDDLRARFKFQIHVPDLNSRREDVPLLLRSLLHRISLREPALSERMVGASVLALTPSLDFKRRLVTHEYHAHVRELEAIVWAALQACSGEQLEWPGDLRVRPPEAVPPAVVLPYGTRQSGAAVELSGTNHGAIEEAPLVIQRVLEEHNGRIELAWKALGLKNRYALRRLIAKYGIEVRRRPGR